MLLELRNMLKDIYFYHLQENIKTITGYYSKNSFQKKVVHKSSQFLENKITDAVTKSDDDKIEKKEPVEKIIIPLEKRDEILNYLRQALL